MNKGQVTVFIIIGMIIVAVIGAAFYFRNQLIRDSFETDRERAALVPDQIRPVKLFIDECVGNVASDAIDLLAFQGGYLELPEDNIATSNLNRFSNSLRLTGNSAARTAYWSYETANGISIEQAPSQEEMENSIASYVTVNINDCLDGMEQFSYDGFNISREAARTVDVRILDNNVEIILDQPVNIRFRDIDFTIEKHFADVDKPLGKFYDLARQIHEREEESYFLEDKTIDMLVVYDELPYSDTDLSCETRIWTKSQVERDFRNILEGNIAALKVDGSDYRLSSDKEYFVIEELDGRYEDASIAFRYSKDWPLKLEIEPSDGELLKGTGVNNELGNNLEGFLTSLFCLTDYHFVYDIKYPVLITISNGEFTFQHATQVILDNNQARENLLGEEEVIEAGDEICNNLDDTRTIVNTVVELPDGRFLPISDVDVSYSCVTVTCNIGRSQGGKIEANLPACLNGVMIAKKEGYNPGRDVVSSNAGVETSVILRPMYTKRLTVNLIDKDTGEIREPFGSEKVVFEFDGQNYDTSVVWPENNEITLVPGRYSVRSYVIGSSTWDIRIADRQIESCVEVPDGFLGVFGSTRQECRTVDVPGMTLEEAVKGGANFNYEFSHANLAAANNVVLYTIVDDIPGSYESLTDVYESIETNAFDSKFTYPRLE